MPDGQLDDGVATLATLGPPTGVWIVVDVDENVASARGKRGNVQVSSVAGGQLDAFTMPSEEFGRVKVQDYLGSCSVAGGTEEAAETFVCEPEEDPAVERIEVFLRGGSRRQTLIEELQRALVTHHCSSEHRVVERDAGTARPLQDGCADSRRGVVQVHERPRAQEPVALDGRPGTVVGHVEQSRVVLDELGSIHGSKVAVSRGGPTAVLVAYRPLSTGPDFGDRPKMR